MFILKEDAVALREILDNGLAEIAKTGAAGFDLTAKSSGAAKQALDTLQADIDRDDGSAG